MGYAGWDYTGEAPVVLTQIPEYNSSKHTTIAHDRPLPSLPPSLPPGVTQQRRELSPSRVGSLPNEQRERRDEPT